MIHFLKYTKKQIAHLPLAVTMLGDRHLQEPILRPSGLSIFQCFFCESGSGEFVISGRKTILKEGQFLLLYPDVGHSYRGLTADWTLSFISFTGRNPGLLLKTLGMHESGVYQMTGRFDGSAFFHDSLKKMQEQEALPDSEKQLRLSVSCYEFLMEFSAHSRYSPADSYGSDNAAVTGLISFMEEHYAEPISIDQLAAEVGYSAGYTQALFKKEIGHSMGKHLEMIRLIHARLLLTRYPEKRVADIAKECGFFSPSYFGLVFKRETGKTPAQFRTGNL